MSGDIVPLGLGGLVSGSSGGGLASRREARELERRSAIGKLHEQARMELAQLRVHNGVALAAHAAMGITALDGVITAVSADKPFLELELRQLQRVTGVGVAGIIANYMIGGT